MSTSLKPAGQTERPVQLEPAVTFRVLKSVPRQLRGILSLDDFKEAARRRLPRPIFGYVSGATKTGAGAVMSGWRPFGNVRFDDVRLGEAGAIMSSACECGAL
jgi:hypothetical protein